MGYGAWIFFGNPRSSQAILSAWWWGQVSSQTNARDTCSDSQSIFELLRRIDRSCVFSNGHILGFQKHKKVTLIPRDEGDAQGPLGRITQKVILYLTTSVPPTQNSLSKQRTPM